MDFSDNAESALPDKQTVKAVTDDLRIAGEAEVMLDLSPNPGVYLNGAFDEPRLLTAMMSAMSEPESSHLLDRHDQRIERVPAGSCWSTFERSHETHSRFGTRTKSIQTRGGRSCVHGHSLGATLSRTSRAPGEGRAKQFVGNARRTRSDSTTIGERAWSRRHPEPSSNGEST